MSPWILIFVWGMTRLMIRPGWMRCSSHPLSRVVSLLVFTLLFSRTGDVLFHQNSSIHTFPQYPLRNLCFFVTSSLCPLQSLMQRTHPSVKLHLSRIGRMENPSCSTCGQQIQDPSHLILHCPAKDSLRRSLVGDSLRPVVMALESRPVYGAPWSPVMPPSLERGWITTTA